ncbi:MAG: M28 family peptidase [Planctomycetes bacterium]|nr:M28 family peptidase [Planctomycetota bacterium]MBL7043552.1 M28 family peptidase [Pirellulaceae bacterium]
MRSMLPFLLVLILPIVSTAEEPKATRPVMVLKMPGKSYHGELPELTAEEMALAKTLRNDVLWLATEIGERNVHKYENLVKAARYIEQSFANCGYTVERNAYQVRGRECWNVIAERKGQTRPNEIVVVGAHYDSVTGSPGANDNVSGVAGVLALARSFSRKPTARTLRLVAFTNEEPPYFQTDLMGSRVYAQHCKKAGDNIVGMLCLETIGYFSDEEDSQKYPLPFSLYYPSTGNFIAFVANADSASLVKNVAESFRRHAKFPSEGCALPERVTGVGWSDHWSFWQEGYQALMVTDTAPFRYPYYHRKEDTPDKLDYERMARVVSGMQHVIEEFAAASWAAQAK